MANRSARDVLLDVVAALPDDTRAEPNAAAEMMATAALAVLTEPTAADAALAELEVLERLASANPRIVHQVDYYEDTPDLFEDPDDPTLRTTQGGRRYTGLVDCPDCTRGLVSLGGAMACIQVHVIRDRVDLSGVTDGDVVACGKER